MATESNFYGYTQARTVSNISSHGTSLLSFCKKKTPLRNAMCEAVKDDVNVYSTIHMSCLSWTYINPLFLGSRLGNLIAFMAAFIEVMIYFQNTPHLWEKICKSGTFLLLANIGANLSTLGRGKEISKLNKYKNSRFLEEFRLTEKPLSSNKFERSQKIDKLGQHLPAPIEIFTFERSHSKELLINVKNVYDTLGYDGPQSISDMKRVQLDYDRLTQANKNKIDSAGNNDFSGVHLSICQYCKENGETLTAVCTTPFDVTDLINYDSLCNGYVQYNITNAGGEKTGWMTINPTNEKKSKIKQAISYIMTVLITINRALGDDDDVEVEEEEDEEDREEEREVMKVEFFKDPMTGKNIAKIKQINSFALHVLSAIVSQLILSLILHPENATYTHFAPITNDPETSVQNLIEQINHCKSYYYSNACKKVNKRNYKFIKKWIESEPVYGESQQQFDVLSEMEPRYRYVKTELDKFDSGGPGGGGGGAADNSSSASGGNSSMTPQFAIVEDMNDLIKTGLSKNETDDIVELIKIFDPTDNGTRKRSFVPEKETIFNLPKRGGRKSKKHKRKNMKKQSRRNKKYTR